MLKIPSICKRSQTGNVKKVNFGHGGSSVKGKVCVLEK